VPACCSCSDVFQYKVTQIQSINYGIIKWFFHMIVFSYVSFALVSDKLYQWKEPAISSVHSKVKRIAEVKEEIMENGVKKLVHSVFNMTDYTFPLQRRGFTMLARLVSISCPRDLPALASQSTGITGMSHLA
uniref:Uncharacterized protein n=1 Tax=Theropithecus gelada TaxID=9565 RepID=A0A8D2FE99_THEGE